MNKILLSRALMFMSGAILGAVATRQYFKTKYENKLKEDLDKEYAYIRNHRDVEEAAEALIEGVKEGITSTEETYKKYRNIIHKSGYKEEGEEGEKTMNKPYVISPEEAEDCEYDIEILTYYEDGTLTNDFDDVIEDRENTVGNDFMNHFGEHEKDTVYVRNDEKELVYEINRDLRKYVEIYHC